MTSERHTGSRPRAQRLTSVESRTCKGKEGARCVWGKLSPQNCSGDARPRVCLTAAGTRRKSAPLSGGGGAALPPPPARPPRGAAMGIWRLGAPRAARRHLSAALESPDRTGRSPIRRSVCWSRRRGAGPRVSAEGPRSCSGLRC